jgi:O-acetyl-ADP-ribose deacetylase (regulator of RNase III)
MGQDLAASPEIVRRAARTALRRAEEMRLQSIAFPAFGTGVGRMPAKDSADAMVGALRAHLAEVPASTLRRVYLVLFQDDTYRAFAEALGIKGARRVG